LIFFASKSQGAVHHHPEGRVSIRKSAVWIAVPVAVFAFASCSDSSGPDEAISQFASSATASSEYTPDAWSALQAVGEPNAPEGCIDHPNAWASRENSGEDWLEVTFETPVFPTQIDIYEVYAPGSIGKVEVKLASGKYATVYSTTPGEAQTCPRILSFSVSKFVGKISVVRIHVDQRTLQSWDEIDAVKLVGRP
jgi:hypothetical protein